ncbi:hypothetical protein HMPREF9153_1925 [Cutibacterium avidum ATCC 25577]|uniref:Uncharacterized protein n=1 Tax=Cutibacterium avidum ATCC 25577 TaxID=997355 RepID=G4CZQ3_9ACTN|nr:hypothetical protein HMPREF9153_1925 [Cutibacterium avidum ATCC 25577]
MLSPSKWVRENRRTHALRTQGHTTPGRRQDLVPIVAPRDR